jgi:hypothetical protein
MRPLRGQAAPQSRRSRSRKVHLGEIGSRVDWEGDPKASSIHLPKHLATSPLRVHKQEEEEGAVRADFCTCCAVCLPVDPYRVRRRFADLRIDLAYRPRALDRLVGPSNTSSFRYESMSHDGNHLPCACPCPSLAPYPCSHLVLHGFPQIPSAYPDLGSSDRWRLHPWPAGTSTHRGEVQRSKWCTGI